jgi:aspartate-semialdehyde dehydrogenase
MKKCRVAVVGATGMVGQTFIQVLEERNFPIESISFFASERSSNKTIEFHNQTYMVETLHEHSFDQGFDIALFSAGGKVSIEYAPIAANAGAVVIDNSSAWRMNPNVPLIVPEVNAHVLTKDNKIIANPNCSTIQSVVALKVIDDLYGIKRVVYSTYQAVSGSGYKGVKDLEDGYLGSGPTFYPKPIVGNCIPHIDDFLESGYTKEEMKMVHETKKILGKELAVTATCVRVPVMIGHSVSINVECERSVDIHQLRAAYEQTEGIVYYPNQTYPTPIDSAGQDLVYVGRLRIDESVQNGLNLWVVADNIRKGAATNAIQIAEYLIKEELL